MLKKGGGGERRRRHVGGGIEKRCFVIIYPSCSMKSITYLDLNGLANTETYLSISKREKRSQGDPSVRGKIGGRVVFNIKPKEWGFN